MKTLTIPIADILESIYAASALIHLGARHLAQPPAILHRDHAAALTRVIADALSVAVTWVADGTIHTYHIDDTHIHLTVPDDTLPDNLLNPMRQAIAMITLHIACTAAGLKTDCLATARAALATTRPWHPATIHPYW